MGSTQHHYAMPYINTRVAFFLFDKHNDFVIVRGRVSLTRHNIEFPIPLPPSTLSDHLNPDKTKLRETIFDLRNHGWSFRQIAQEVGLHWTRIQQIVNES